MSYSPEKLKRLSDEVYRIASDGLAEYKGVDVDEKILQEAAATLRQQAARVDEDSLRATAQAMREEAANGSNEFRDMMHGYADSIEAALSAQPAERQGEAVAYFSADPAEGEFNTYKTLAEAVAGAESLLESAQDDASDYGWQDEPPQICYGVVLGKCVELEGSRRPAPEGSEFTSLVDYRLTEPTHPAAPVGVPDEAKDAARYRFIRDKQATIIYKRKGHGEWEPLLDTRESSTRCASLDAAVDSAMELDAAPSAPQGEGHD